MPEVSDFQRTNSEFAKFEQRYPVKISCYWHWMRLPSENGLNVRTAVPRSCRRTTDHLIGVLARARRGHVGRHPTIWSAFCPADVGGQPTIWSACCPALVGGQPTIWSACCPTNVGGQPTIFGRHALPRVRRRTTDHLVGMLSCARRRTTDHLVGMLIYLICLYFRKGRLPCPEIMEAI
jgi:hypothetical protein